jgi:(p)ppGpp synthase/HD superfamily hydrolase
MTEKIRKAIAFAMERHAGQVRKGSGLPYIVHVISVFASVRKYKDSKKWEDICCAAILHDILEDTATTFDELVQEFGPLVASIVYELTNDEEQIALVGKQEYMKKKLLGISSYALTIKFCDQLDNLSDRPTAKLYERIVDLISHVKANRRLSSSQVKIVAQIEDYIATNKIPVDNVKALG